MAPIKITIPGPVDVPGHVLTAGSYTIEPDETQGIVRVFDGNDKLIGTFEVISAERPNDGELASQVNLKTLTTGAPEGIDTVFGAGETIGFEFVYPTKE